MSFLVFMAVVVSLLSAVIAGINFGDRICVYAIRTLNLRCYKTAVSIAVLIVQYPEQWTATAHELRHPIVGDVWTGNDAYGITVTTQFGKWKPNIIERRIIREAVDWRIGFYIENRIAAALQHNASLQQPDRKTEIVPS